MRSRIAPRAPGPDDESVEVGRVSAPGSAHWVLHLDMDAFFASVEQLTRPTLRGRPVLVGGLGGRGVVAGASYEARVFGARSAMPMHQARRLIGNAGVVVPPRGVLYGELSRRVFAVVREFMPVLEQLSVDEAFGEPEALRGAGPEQVREFAERLRAAVLERTGLTASIGAGPGKQVAKIGSGLAKPDGVVVIERARVAEVLHPLPVRKLWGIGPVAEAKLLRNGIETIGALAQTAERDVAALIGPGAAAVHASARGIDDRPVAERAEAKSVSAETTFAEDIVTVAQLRGAVDELAAAAYRRLERDGRAAKTVVLKLKRSDMSILTRSVTLAQPTTDPDVLAASAQRSVLDPEQIGAIRLVGVGYSGLSATAQTVLFPELDQPERQADSAQPPPRARSPRERWYPGVDVEHPEFGHGWVQGAGHAVVTVRFETATTAPGPVRTFADDDEALTIASPLGSLGDLGTEPIDDDDPDGPGGSGASSADAQPGPLG